MGAQYKRDQQLNHCGKCEAPLVYCECGNENITP